MISDFAATQSGAGLEALTFAMRTSDAHARPLPVSTAPVGTDQHFETERRSVWDEDTHKYEEREFLYEVSWVPELGVWRRFLRSHRKA